MAPAYVVERTVDSINTKSSQAADIPKEQLTTSANLDSIPADLPPFNRPQPGPDRYPNDCPKWVGRGGGCARNAVWMEKNCPMSCWKWDRDQHAAKVCRQLRMRRLESPLSFGDWQVAESRSRLDQQSSSNDEESQNQPEGEGSVRDDEATSKPTEASEGGAGASEIHQSVEPETRSLEDNGAHIDHEDHPQPTHESEPPTGDSKQPEVPVNTESENGADQQQHDEQPIEQARTHSQASAEEVRVPNNDERIPQNHQDSTSDDKTPQSLESKSEGEMSTEENDQSQEQAPTEQVQHEGLTPAELEQKRELERQHLMEGYGSARGHEAQEEIEEKSEDLAETEYLEEQQRLVDKTTKQREFEENPSREAEATMTATPPDQLERERTDERHSGNAVETNDERSSDDQAAHDEPMGTDAQVPSPPNDLEYADDVATPPTEQEYPQESDEDSRASPELEKSQHPTPKKETQTEENVKETRSRCLSSSVRPCTDPRETLCNLLPRTRQILTSKCCDFLDFNFEDECGKVGERGSSEAEPREGSGVKADDQSSWPCDRFAGTALSSCPPERCTVVEGTRCVSNDGKTSTEDVLDQGGAVVLTDEQEGAYIQLWGDREPPWEDSNLDKTVQEERLDLELDWREQGYSARQRFHMWAQETEANGEEEDNSKEAEEIAESQTEDREKPLDEEERNSNGENNHVDTHQGANNQDVSADLYGRPAAHRLSLCKDAHCSQPLGLGRTSADFTSRTGVVIGAGETFSIMAKGNDGFWEGKFSDNEKRLLPSSIVEEIAVFDKSPRFSIAGIVNADGNAVYQDVVSERPVTVPQQDMPSNDGTHSGGVGNSDGEKQGEVEPNKDEGVNLAGDTPKTSNTAPGVVGEGEQVEQIDSTHEDNLEGVDHAREEHAQSPVEHQTTSTLHANEKHKDLPQSTDGEHHQPNNANNVRQTDGHEDVKSTVDIPNPNHVTQSPGAKSMPVANGDGSGGGFAESLSSPVDVSALSLQEIVALAPITFSSLLGLNLMLFCAFLFGSGTDKKLEKRYTDTLNAKSSLELQLADTEKAKQEAEAKLARGASSEGKKMKDMEARVHQTQDERAQALRELESVRESINEITAHRDRLQADCNLMQHNHAQELQGLRMQLQDAQAARDTVQKEMEDAKAATKSARAEYTKLSDESLSMKNELVAQKAEVAKLGEQLSLRRANEDMSEKSGFLPLVWL